MGLIPRPRPARVIGAFMLTGLLAALAACEEGAVPTATSASAAAAPTIAGIDMKDEGNGIVSLKARATDPGGSALSFAWKVDDGQLSNTTSANTQWRVPKKEGKYTATLEVTNAKGAKVTGTQTFSVDAQGKTTETGTLSVQIAAGPTASQTKSSNLSGGFAIPSPLGSLAGNPPIVGGNPAAPAASTPPPSGPLAQPVATPVPGSKPSPTALPIQPLATPTPTPPPVVLPASPLPTAAPPTPEPGVPEAAPLRWQRYDPSKVPGTPNFKGIHFTSPTRGWLVGSGPGATVMLYNKTGTEEPALVLRNPPLQAFRTATRVFFTSETQGFIAGDQGLVMRTNDAGVTWEDLSIPNEGGIITGLVVYNTQSLVVCEESGRVYRTDSADIADPTQIVWNTINSKPVDRAADATSRLLGAAGFQTDPSVTYFAGDGVYKLDFDNADNAKKWTRVLQIQPPNFDLHQLGDNVMTSIKMVSQNEIMAGSQTGNFLQSKDGGSTWTRLDRTKYKNREFNGNQFFLDPPDKIASISATNSNNIFLATDFGVYDSNDGAAQWRDSGPSGLTDFQVVDKIENNKATFVGFGVSNGGALYVYKPGF